MASASGHEDKRSPDQPPPRGQRQGQGQQPSFSRSRSNLGSLGNGGDTGASRIGGSNSAASGGAGRKDAMMPKDLSRPRSDKPGNADSILCQSAPGSPKAERRALPGTCNHHAHHHHHHHHHNQQQQQHRRHHVDPPSAGNNGSSSDIHPNGGQPAPDAAAISSASTGREPETLRRGHRHQGHDRQQFKSSSVEGASPPAASASASTPTLAGASGPAGSGPIAGSAGVACGHHLCQAQAQVSGASVGGLTLGPTAGTPSATMASAPSASTLPSSSSSSTSGAAATSATIPTNNVVVPAAKSCPINTCNISISSSCSSSSFSGSSANNNMYSNDDLQQPSPLSSAASSSSSSLSPPTGSSTTSGVAAAAAASGDHPVLSVSGSATSGSLAGVGGNGVLQVGGVLEDSDADDLDLGQQATSSRSRQKKFLKNFKQLPQEEVVLQRYSCALVSDILLQGHLYITENYFAFHSNVFGYVTKLQIPIRSVSKVTKEKTAKIIPNAIGILTVDLEKHIFSSLLSRDATFKLMTRLWKRAMKDLLGPPAESIAGCPDLALEVELDDEELENLNDYMSSDSDEVTIRDCAGDHPPAASGGGVDSGLQQPALAFPSSSEQSSQSTDCGAPFFQHEGLVLGSHRARDITESSYLVKRVTAASGQSNGGGGIFYKAGPVPVTSANKASKSRCKKTGCGIDSMMAVASAATGDRHQDRRLSSSAHSSASGRADSRGGGEGCRMASNLLSQLTKSTIVSIFVIVLLIFLFCSSMYLVFRIDSLQKQVESRYGQRPAKPGADDVRTDDGILRKSPWNELLEAESTGNIMHKVLDSNVGHISTVRKSLEKIQGFLSETIEDEDGSSSE